MFIWKFLSHQSQRECKAPHHAWSTRQTQDVHTKEEALITEQLNRGVLNRNIERNKKDISRKTRYANRKN